jgi:DNA-binding MarR family transcriptional regulator
MEGHGLTPSGICHATALRKATRHVTNMFDSVLAPTGLRSTQRSILVHIARANGPSVKELAVMLVLDRSALTHNLKPLIRDGLVCVQQNPADKRGRVVGLTSLGEQKLKDSDDLWHQAQATYEKSFGVEDASALRAVLGRVASLRFDLKS